MPNLARLRALSPHEQALVCTAVLLDGHDAVEFLSCDLERHLALTRAAKDLAELPPDLKLPLAGMILRQSLSMLSSREL